MQPKVILTEDGQELELDDLNLIASTAALADDRALAELLRIPANAGTVSKRIIPYSEGATVLAAGGANGSVEIWPFRAIVGARTNVTTDTFLGARDIRSALFVGSATSLKLTQAFAANASGNSRWDLICAVVAVDANSPSVSRLVKDPTTEVVSEETVVVTQATTVSISVTAGTPAATPTFPAAPSDSGSTYYIPLAYVRIPTGFGATTVVAKSDICVIAAVAGVHATAGGVTMRPARCNNDLAGQYLATDYPWLGTAAQRPLVYLPSTMAGKEERFILLDTAGTTVNLFVDDSIDWRDRFFKWTIVVLGPTGNLITEGSARLTSPTETVHGLGSSCRTPHTNDVIIGGVGYGANLHDAFTGSTTYVPQISTSGLMGATSAFGLYVDTSGRLKIIEQGASNTRATIWLEATARYANRG